MVAGTMLAITELVVGPIRFPDGVAGGVLQVTWLVLAFIVLQQIYIRIERWDAIRSGRRPHR